MSLPKVLILNQPFTTNTGGGITLSNLMRGWDADKLAVACSGYELQEKIDHSFGAQYYQLGEKEHKWMFPFSLIKRKYPSGPVSLQPSEAQEAPPSAPASKLRVKLIMNVFYPLLEYLGVFHAASTYQLSPEFCAWMDEFEPDLIYAQASDRGSIAFCIAVQAYLQKKMIFHMMDDWPTVISSKGLLKNYWRRRIDQEFRELLAQSEIFLSISDYMAEEYARRYGKNSQAFHNPINTEFWQQYQRSEYTYGQEMTLLYAGRVGLGIQESLQTIAEAVQKLNQELNLGMKFVLQTAEAPAWASNYTCVQHRKYVAYQDLPRVFAEANFLILPYDFSPKANQYIKYSMPTKASEYMASGTPIIIFAPEDTALVRYAQAQDWAAVVTENRIEYLCQTLKRLIQDQSYRTHFANNAKALAKSRHDVQQVSRNFKDVLLCAAERQTVHS